MSEEIPFKPMKITLSEEAVDMLASLRQGGAFRSDSATIEECIRVINSILRDYLNEIERAQKDSNGNLQRMNSDRQCEMLRRILIMTNRFGRTITIP